jgi:hypothetical protein
MPTGAQRIEAALAHWVAPGADAASIADAGCSIWRRVATILSPIVGHLGVAALYKRSLHLTRAEHPWLSGVHDQLGGLEDLGDFATLRAALSSQTGTNAAAANTALLATFYDLLSSLIGASLTERLLGSVLDKPSIDHAAQDSTP